MNPRDSGYRLVGLTEILLGAQRSLGYEPQRQVRRSCCCGRRTTSLNEVWGMNPRDSDLAQLDPRILQDAQRSLGYEPQRQ